MKEYKNYTEYLNNKQTVEQMKRKGFKFEYKNTKKIILGIVGVSICFILPFVDVLLLPFSIWLMGFSYIDIKNKYLPELVRKLKNRCKKWN